MAKAKKQALKNLSKAVEAKQVSAKDAAKYRAIGTAIVSAETETTTVYDAMMAAFGLSDAALVIVADAIDKKWEAIYKAIKGSAPEVKGKKQIVEVSQRTAYNRRSDDVAVINAFRAMSNDEKHGMTAGQFRKDAEKISTAHTDKRNTLVMLARAYIGKRAGKGKTEDSKVKRVVSAWKNKGSEVLKSLKLQIAHAPLASLMVLQDIIEARISAIKKQAKAPVSQLRKAA